MEEAGLRNNSNERGADRGRGNVKKKVWAQTSQLQDTWKIFGRQVGRWGRLFRRTPWKKGGFSEIPGL